MAVINPEHLLEQARRLLDSRNARGQVRQVDRRRAISAAYYAVFHAALTAVADEFVGIAQRKSERYGLVYRSVDHKSLEALCRTLSREQLSEKFARYAPENGFGPNIREFATLLVELKEKRISADYDPVRWINVVDAAKAIESADSAIKSFKKVSLARRKAFLALLVFPPR